MVTSDAVGNKTIEYTIPATDIDNNKNYNIMYTNNDVTAVIIRSLQVVYSIKRVV